MTTLAMNERGNPAEYTGHGVNTGGLQRHSIGDTYPFTVVGTMHRVPGGDNVGHTQYYVQNLITGERYYRDRSHWADSFEDHIVTWVSCQCAHSAAWHLAQGDRGSTFGIVNIDKLPKP